MNAPERIQRKRTKGWRMPEGAIYVGRPTRWGNPFNIEWHGRDLAVETFRRSAQGGWNPFRLDHLSDAMYDRMYDAHTRWYERLGGHPVDLARSELHGHDLACWCPLDQPCHADVLLEIANE